MLVVDTIKFAFEEFTWNQRKQKRFSCDNKHGRCDVKCKPAISERSFIIELNDKIKIDQPFSVEISENKEKLINAFFNFQNTDERIIHRPLSGILETVMKRKITETITRSAHK